VGLLLFDTGIGTGNAEIDEAHQPTVRDLRSLMRERGLEPDEVVAPACSHLHFDHAGQNLAFQGRPIHVQAAEREAARAADYTIDAWADFPGAHYVEHAGEVELLPGVGLIPTPGHTPCHQSLVVDGTAGRTVLIGQAVYTRAEWDGSTDPAVSVAESAWDRRIGRRWHGCVLSGRMSCSSVTSDR
jgi:N-acyl homoserine lactone hydrolase